MHVVGLTSPRNLEFTRGLGLYDEVLTYDEFETASVFTPEISQKWVYVDVAGNDALNKRVFDHFTKLYSTKSQTKLVAAIQLGLTNLTPSSKDASSTKWSTNTFESRSTSDDKANQFESDTPVTTLEQLFMPEWSVPIPPHYIIRMDHQLIIPNIGSPSALAK
jgi:hypothetical protein